MVGNSKVSSGPLLMEVEKRMPKVRVDEGSGVRSTIHPIDVNHFNPISGIPLWVKMDCAKHFLSYILIVAHNNSA